MSAAPAATPLEPLFWRYLDARGAPETATAAAALLGRLADPPAVRRFAQLCLDHVLLREVLQEARAAAQPDARLPDKELVAQAEQGVPGAMDVLVERYFSLAVGAAYAVLTDGDAARDVAQEAFLEAARTLPALRERDKFGHWVYGIARRKAIYVLRRRQLHQAALSHRREEQLAQPPVEEPGAPLAREERARVVREALEQLPEIYREILALKYIDDRSYEEIADLLGLSRAAVDKRLTRAKALLRETLRGWQGL